MIDQAHLMQTFAGVDSPWDLYLREVEDLAGERVADSAVLDLLYDLYRKDVPATDAVEALPGLKRAGVAVQAVLKEIEEMHAMRRKEDVYARFQGRAGAERPTPSTAPRAWPLRRHRRLAHGLILGAAALFSLALLTALVACQMMQGPH